MKKIMYILLFCMFCISGCVRESCERSISLENKTAHTIYFAFGNSSGVIHSYNVLLGDLRIDPCSTYAYRGICLADLTNDWSEPLNIYFIDSLTIHTVPWDSIRKHEMVLKKQTYTKKQLRNLEWHIGYPEE